MTGQCSFIFKKSFLDVLKFPKGGEGGNQTDAWVGRCGPGVETLTLFKTQFPDRAIPFKSEC